MTAPEDGRGARRSILLAELCLPGAVITELRGPADPADLDDEERAACATFGDARRSEFAAGRLCARLALRELGHPRVPLAVRSDRRPDWPDGIVGSISHTRDYCAALVARTRDLRAVGFDVETRGRIGDELREILFTQRERDRMAELSSAERDLIATIVFSAKESYYKCQFALTRRWLDFTDVEIDIGVDGELGNGIFTMREVVDARGDERYVGRYLTTRALVATSVSIVA